MEEERLEYLYCNMKTKTINTFSGGIAEDVREARTNTFSYASGFDTFSNSHRISPYRTMETESVDSGTLSTFGLTETVIMKDSVNTNIYALGHSSSDNNIKFFQKATAMDITASFQACTGGEDSTGNVIPGTLAAYNAKLYALRTDNVNTVLVEYNHATSTLAAKQDGGSGQSLNGISANVKPFVHPMDDILYVGHSNWVSKLDGTTLTRNVLELPSEIYITSLTSFGAYLAIATAPVNGGISSKVYLWNRDTSVTTVTEVIDFGEGELKVLENISGTLVGVMSNKIPTTNSLFNIKTKLSLKTYAGGQPVNQKEITTTSSVFTLHSYKAKQSNKLFFACSASLNGTALNQIWVAGFNDAGQWFMTPDRLINNNTALTGQINGFSLLGDYLWAGFNDDGSFFRTRFTSATYPTATYESLTNHSMDLDDRTKKKKLHFVSVAKSSTTGQLVVSVSVDGGAYQTVVTLASGGSLVKKEARLATAAPFTDGYEFRFKVESTNGAEMTELKYAYEVIEKNI